jgi:uncharacterized membrane protein
MQTSKLLFIFGGLALLYIVLGVLGPIPLFPATGTPLVELVRCAALVLFVAVSLIWLLAMIRKARNRGNKFSEDSSAEQILRERYARGELDRAQFAQMLNDLRGDLSPSL